MDKNYYFGIDVSKNTLDVSFYVQETLPKHFPHIQVSNDKEGWKEMLHWAKTCGAVLKESAFMMEYTGCYSDGIRQYLSSKHHTFCMANPLEVKYHSGVTRDKNDKVDSARIADYLARYSDRIEPSHLPSKILRDLDDLRKERKFYVEQRTALKNRIKTVTNSIEHAHHQSLISKYDKEVERVEEALVKLMQKDDAVWKSYVLLSSIRGIGLVNAVNVIVITENFTSFQTARQYASYIGVAPHGRNSGTSVHRRVRPSTYSDLQAKADLSEAADCVRRTDRDMRQYYQRKMKDRKEDPALKRITLNNIKFKLILRMFAVIKRGTPYINDELDYVIAKSQQKNDNVSETIQPQMESENYDNRLPDGQIQSVLEAPSSIDN